MKKGLLLIAAIALGACSGNPKPQPPTPPTPTPPPPVTEVPPLGTPVAPNELARPTADGKMQTNETPPRPINPFMAVPCCMPWEKCSNQGWPNASACFIDETHKYGADTFHFRLGPWDAEHEPDWAAIGGPYKAGSLEWNDAYWTEIRRLAWKIHTVGGRLEAVPIDSWYIKVCRQDGSLCPWPAAEIQAAGRTPAPEAERFLRKSVQELGCFGWVQWATGNEEDLVPGMSVSWLNWQIDVIRDEEQKSGCGFVHIIGTGSFQDGVKADYQITHERAPVTGPCRGLWCVNNEHNPEFKPDEEAALFAQARRAGQVWAAWRAEANDEDWEKRLGLFKKVVDGDTATGCFVPYPEDPLWVSPPQAGSVGDNMLPAVREAQAVVGDRCGFIGPCPGGPGEPEGHHCQQNETLALVAAELRKKGYCASGPWPDAVAVVNPQGFTQEFHAVAFGTGCFTADPAANPKSSWTYSGTLPKPPSPTPPPEVGTCTNPNPIPISTFGVKEHTKGPNRTVVDSTPLVHGAAYCASIGFTDGRVDCPVRQEGDPLRPVCESEVVGTPAWTGPGAVSPENPYQYWVPRGVGGTVTVCTSVQPQVCGSVEVAP